MKLYKFSLSPTSNFATPLQGDTIFGQICWLIRYNFGEDRLRELLSDYEDNPFLIISDGFAKGFLPKPSLPSHILKENPDLKKENRKKIWLKLEDLQNGNYTNAKIHKEINNLLKTESTIKNSLNYKTFKTEKEKFSPYSIEEFFFSSQDIYLLIDEDRFSIKEFEEVLKLLSEVGYGKDTTIGKGRFEFSEIEEIKIDFKSNSYMTLSNVVLKDIDAKKVFYSPITKFAKHGYEYANKSAFKKPLLFAKSGSVIVFENRMNLQYIGSCIKNYSNHKDTIHQGYSIVIPIKDIRDEI